jgi:hypothetical protein
MKQQNFIDFQNFIKLQKTNEPVVETSEPELARQMSEYLKIIR